MQDVDLTQQTQDQTNVEDPTQDQINQQIEQMKE